MAHRPPIALLTRGRVRLLAALLALLLGAAPAEARRVALVIGNGAYEAVPRLVNPVPDADAVAAVLRGHGFAVTRLADAGRAALDAALRRFAAEATGAEVALFFFAGHGMRVDGENHIVPTDARLARPTDVDFELIPLDLVVRALAGAQARVLILDACRDNPLAANLPAGTRSVGRGLASVQRVDLGTLIAFSTAPGAVALDGTGANSPFSAALVEHLRTPGLEIRQVMTRVRRSVVQATGGRQVPWDNSSLLGDVVLARPGAGAPLAAPAPAPLASRTEGARLPPPPAAAAPAPPGPIAEAAARRNLVLPAALPALTRGGSGLTGVFATPLGANRVGRDLLVIVAPLPDGASDVLLAAGPGAPGSFSAGLGPLTLRQTVRPGFGGGLNLRDAAGDEYQIWQGWGGRVAIGVTRPGLQGWVRGTGRDQREIGHPAEQVVLDRIP